MFRKNSLSKLLSKSWSQDAILPIKSKKTINDDAENGSISIALLSYPSNAFFSYTLAKFRVISTPCHRVAVFNKFQFFCRFLFIIYANLFDLFWFICQSIWRLSCINPSKLDCAAKQYTSRINGQKERKKSMIDNRALRIVLFLFLLLNGWMY